MKRDSEGQAYSTDKSSHGKIPRRLVLEQDSNIVNPSMHVGIDITGIPNANTQCPVVLFVQEKCNLGDWHTIEKISIMPWGSD